MEVINLRNTIVKLLEPNGLIGEYNYSNGHIGQAISVGNPPNNIEVTGLEYILPLYPLNTTQQYSTTIYEKAIWKFYIIQREGATSIQLKQAGDILKNNFRQLHILYVPQSTVIGSYAQLCITYCHKEIL